MSNFWGFLRNSKNVFTRIIQSVIRGGIAVLNRFFGCLRLFYDTICALFRPRCSSPTPSRRCSESDVNRETSEPQPEPEIRDERVTAAEIHAVPSSSKTDNISGIILTPEEPKTGSKSSSSKDRTSYGISSIPRDECTLSPTYEEAEAQMDKKNKAKDKVETEAEGEDKVKASTSYDDKLDVCASPKQTSTKSEKSADDVPSIPRDEKIPRTDEPKSETKSPSLYGNEDFGEFSNKDKTSYDISSIPRDESTRPPTNEQAKAQVGKEDEDKDKVETEAEAEDKAKASTTGDQLAVGSSPPQTSAKGEKSSDDSMPHDEDIPISEPKTETKTSSSSKDKTSDDVSSIPRDESFLEKIEEKTKAEIIEEGEDEDKVESEAEAEDQAKDSTTGDDQLAVGTSSTETSVRGEKSSDDISSMPRDEDIHITEEPKPESKTSPRYINEAFGEPSSKDTSDDVSSLPRDESFLPTIEEEAKGEIKKGEEDRDKVETGAKTKDKAQAATTSIDQLSSKEGHVFEDVCSDDVDKISSLTPETSVSSVPREEGFLRITKEKAKSEPIETKRRAKTKAAIKTSVKDEIVEKAPGDVPSVQRDERSSEIAEKQIKEVEEEIEDKTKAKTEAKDKAEAQILGFDQPPVKEETHSGERTSSSSDEPAVHLSPAKPSIKEDKSSEDSSPVQSDGNIPSTFEDSISLTTSSDKTFAGIHSSIFDKSISSPPRQPAISPSSERLSLRSENTSDDSSAPQKVFSVPTISVSLYSRNDDTLADASSGLLDENAPRTVSETSPVPVAAASITAASIAADSLEAVSNLSSESSPNTTQNSSTNSDVTVDSTSTKNTSEVTISSNPGVMRKTSRFSSSNSFTEGLMYRPLRSESGEAPTQVSELSDPSYGGTASSSDQKTVSTYVRSYSAPPTCAANILRDDQYTFASEAVSQRRKTEPSSSAEDGDSSVHVRPEPRRSRRQRFVAQKKGLFEPRFDYTLLVEGESSSPDTSEAAKSSNAEEKVDPESEEYTSTDTTGPRSRSPEVQVENDPDTVFQSLRQLFHYVDREEEIFLNALRSIRFLWLDYYL